MDEKSYVMVVDDNPDTLQLMTVLLQGEGLEVETAPSGFEAMERIRLRPPSFVILDLMMPGMSGFKVLALLQANPLTRHIPVLIMTASHLKDHDVMDLQGAVLGIVRKGDINLDDISRLVVETLQRDVPGTK